MALGKLRNDDYQHPSVSPRAGKQAGIDVSRVEAVPSPAMALQQRVAQGLSAPAVDKWSPRRSLALIVSSSIALWAAILMAGAHIARAIA